MYSGTMYSDTLNSGTLYSGIAEPIYIYFVRRSLVSLVMLSWFSHVDSLQEYTLCDVWRYTTVMYAVHVWTALEQDLS